MRIEIHERIGDIPAAAWNALVEDGHPFLRHEFLCAMETHGCVGEGLGWLPRHIAVYEAGELVGATPLYEKWNSYGELVFDHAWADAYRRAGKRYYPKLVAAVPYTPATGQRLLCRPGRQDQVLPVLVDAAVALARKLDASGVHWLFPLAREHVYLEGRGLFTRHDCQYHWHNRDYGSFEEFLARLTAKKRKNIRQERRRVVEAGVSLRVLDGHSATAEDWRSFSEFYEGLFERKWGVPTFNYGFFRQVARDLPDRVVLVLADLSGECIAGALMYRSDSVLYGRHWGCSRRVDGLHFEACYYQGIEYCIREGLARFEPGAQGEHKVARGFVPALTRSSHWVAEPGFHRSIGAFVEHERAAVSEYMTSLEAALPYRREGSGA